MHACIKYLLSPVFDRGITVIPGHGASHKERQETQQGGDHHGELGQNMKSHWIFVTTLDNTTYTTWAPKMGMDN